MFRPRVNVRRNGAGEFEAGRVRRGRGVAQPACKPREQFSQADRVRLGVSFQKLNFIFRQLHGQFRRFHDGTLSDGRGKNNFQFIEARITRRHESGASGARRSRRFTFQNPGGLICFCAQPKRTLKRAEARAPSPDCASLNNAGLAPAAVAGQTTLDIMRRAIHKHSHSGRSAWHHVAGNTEQSFARLRRYRAAGRGFVWKAPKP